MKIVKKLEEMDITVTEIPTQGSILKKQWEDSFASHLSHREKEDIYLWDCRGYGGCLWHLFNYKKKDCLEGQEAERVFDKMYKGFCYVFWQDSDYALILENADMLTANDLADEYDIYVVDKDFNWTYIDTHEKGLCGPYFGRREW